MDFLKPSKRRSLLSEVIYIALNVGLAIAVLLVVLAVESPVPAFVLVLLSKWRIMAVRPRYWFAHLRSNLVDIIVSLSIVVLLNAASGALAAQLLLTAFYVGWLLFIKPRSRRLFVTIQAGVALFLGVSALQVVSYGWFASAVVLLMWLIGYSSARHTLDSYDDPHSSFDALIWGLVVAEVGWLTYHWSFGYALPGFGAIQLSQAALITLGLSFLGERIYSSYAHHGEVRSSDVLLPALLSISVIVVLLAFFNSIGNGAV